MNSLYTFLPTIASPKSNLSTSNYKLGTMISALIAILIDLAPLKSIIIVSFNTEGYDVSNARFNSILSLAFNLP